MAIDFRIKADFSPKYFAQDVVIKVPCPAGTAECAIHIGQGKAKYDPAQQGIVWRLKRLSGDAEFAFNAEIQQIQSTLPTERIWARPPISVHFQIAMLSASGLQAEKLTVTEPRLGYQPTKWIRYLTEGGQYQCRL
jgi:AP-2 complex subunit mu-1